MKRQPPRKALISGHQCIAVTKGIPPLILSRDRLTSAYLGLDDLVELRL